MENQRLPTRLTCDRIIENRFKRMSFHHSAGVVWRGWLQVVKRFIVERLGDPELNLNMIAAALGGSVRQIGAIFAPDDSTGSLHPA